MVVAVGLAWLGAPPVLAGRVECEGVRPGAVLVIPLTPPFDPRPFPTFGFVFEGDDGHLYATTAGHVALGIEGGERTWPSGTGIVASDRDGNRVGEFVYAIDTRIGPRPGLPPGADVSLIRVEDTVDVDSAVCGLGGPLGVDTRVVPPTEMVGHHWFGASVVGGRVGHPFPVEGPWLVPARSGFSVGMTSEYQVSVLGHASFGDSGAPVLSDDGLAVGWISGPPRSPDEAGGTFVVSRITPAIERAEEVLGISLELYEARD